MPPERARTDDDATPRFCGAINAENRPETRAATVYPWRSALKTLEAVLRFSDRSREWWIPAKNYIKRREYVEKSSTIS